MKRLFVCFLLLTLPPSVTLAEVSLQEIKNERGGVTIVIENEWVRLAVETFSGGKVSSYIYKPRGNVDWITGPAVPGLFLDHLWQQPWPGTLLDAKYEYEITARGPERAGVRMWKVVPAVDGLHTIWDVRYEKNLMVESGRPALYCSIKLTNTADQPRSPGLWIQHVLNVNRSKENVYFRPSTSGIEVAYNRIVGAERRREHGGADYVRTPVAGWSAALDPSSKLGLVFLADYNYLRWLYNCAGEWTMEAFYDQVRLPPGKSWQTETVLLPVEGFQGIAHVSQRVVADLQAQVVDTAEPPGSQKLVVTSVVAAVDELRDAKLSLAVQSFASKTLVGTRTFNLDRLTRAPVRRQADLPIPAAVRKEGGAVIKATLTTANMEKEEYEIPYAVPVSAAKAPVTKVEYTRPRPRKRKPFSKPTNVQLVPHEGFSAFEARGLWFREWQIEAALKLIPNSKVAAAYLATGSLGPGEIDFPGYDELMRHDVLVLSNIPASALSEEELEMVKEFVDLGGGLLVLGGRYTLGGGHYAGTPLEELLPVVLAGPWDVKKAAPKRYLVPKGQSGVTRSINWEAQRPIVPFYHKTGGLGAGAQVLLEAGGEPFLVTCQRGKGRVAVIPATVEGEGSNGEPAFFEWSEWPKLMSHLMRWLAGEKGGVK